MNVDRYGGHMFERDDGNYVSYQDYQSLKEKLIITRQALTDVLNCINFVDQRPEKEITITLERVEAWRDALNKIGGAE